MPVFGIADAFVLMTSRTSFECLKTMDPWALRDPVTKFTVRIFSPRAVSFIFFLVLACFAKSICNDFGTTSGDVEGGGCHANNE